MVSVRVYHDTRKMYENYVDNWTLYFPVPRKFRNSVNGFGSYLSCNIDNETGKIHYYDWNEHSWNMGLINTNSFYLGKKIKVNTLHPHIQELIQKYEKVWTERWKGDGNDPIVINNWVECEF